MKTERKTNMEKINYWKVTTKNIEFASNKGFSSIKDAKEYAAAIWKEQDLTFSLTKSLVTKTEYTSVTSNVIQQRVYRNKRTNLFEIEEIMIQKKSIIIN